MPYSQGETKKQLTSKPGRAWLRSNGITSVAPLVDVNALRKELGLSLREFSDTFGLDYTSLKHWDQGTSEPKGPSLYWLGMIQKDPEGTKLLVESINEKADARADDVIAKLEGGEPQP